MQPIDSQVPARPVQFARAMPRRRVYPIRALWRCPSSGKTGTPDCIPPYRMRARLFPEGNDSAVSFQSDRHKNRCCDRKCSAPFDRRRAALQSRSRVVLHSTYKSADKVGIRYDHPATSSTTDRNNWIVSDRPFLRGEYNHIVAKRKSPGPQPGEYVSREGQSTKERLSPDRRPFNERRLPTADSLLNGSLETAAPCSGAKYQ